MPPVGSLLVRQLVGGQFEELLHLTPDGDVGFRHSYHDGEALASTNGELEIRRMATPKLGSDVFTGQQSTGLVGRMIPQGILPGGNRLEIRRLANTRAVLDNAGNLTSVGELLANALVDPGARGPVAFTRVVYARAGLNYANALGGAAPQALQDNFRIFQTPTANFTTGNANLSNFAPPLAAALWPFAVNAVPINGVACIPNVGAALPLALFVHGNHSPLDNSTLGYDYLLELLASHGILAASIDSNFLNGLNGEVGGRSVLILEHIKRFRTWNAAGGHPLNNRVDTNNVMIFGHSRGGEAVASAAALNPLASARSSYPNTNTTVPFNGGGIGLGPYVFGLSAVFALAPTQGSFTPRNALGNAVAATDNYILMHGSRDGDVWNFQGYLTLDQLFPATAPAAGFKSLAFVLGADHNRFNSAWLNVDGTPTLSREEHERIARVYVGATAQALLLGRDGYRWLLRDHRNGQQGWLPGGVQIISQYQAADRAFVQSYQQANATNGTNLSIPGAAATQGGLMLRVFAFTGAPTQELYEDTIGARMDWVGNLGEYRMTPNAPINRGTNQYLVLRCGQSTSSLNSAASLQDFQVRLVDNGGNHSVPVSDYGDVPFPPDLTIGTVRLQQIQGSLYQATPSSALYRRAVMQTIRIPLSVFAAQGINVGAITRIDLVFDRPKVGESTVQGSLFIDDIQLSQ